MTEAQAPNFNLSHKDAKPEPDLFSWADDDRTPAKSPKVQAKWELDVKGLISSRRWLKLHGLKRNQLQLNQILARIGFKHSDSYVKPLQKPVGSFYGEGLFHRMKGNKGSTYNITASKETLKDIEKHLKECLHLLKRRQEWLASGSRKIFGVMQERCVCIVLDVSTMVQSQFEMYIDAVCEVLEDQGSQLAKVNLIRAQTDLLEWNERATPVSDVTLKDAINWVRKLDRMVEVSNTCCTEAVIKALEDDTIEAVYLFTEGDVNESSKELLRQKLKECNIPLHAISFNATKPSTVTFLQSMASCTGGRFHAFVVKSDYEDDGDVLGRTSFHHLNKSTSSVLPNKLLSQKTRGGLPHGSGVREDIFIIWTEMEKARNILADLQSLIATVEESTQFQVDSRAVSHHSTERGHDNFSSKDWLKLYGLEANKLTIYHALSGFAFRHIEDVIELQTNPSDSTYDDSQPSLKLIEAKYCKGFPHIMWKDNQIVHVYVSAELYRNYERKMKNILGKIQQRIDWLQQGSREVFGSILEQRIYFLIDTSSSMVQNLKTVKEKLLQMFQEQLRHKSQFNLVKFDTKATSFYPRLENVDESSLKKGWNWVQGLEAEGSTNTLAALQIALSDPNTEGIYLLTDGRPDQPPQCVLSQIQLRKPVPIHTIAFNCNDAEANEFLHKLALDSGGRYHCYTTHGGVGTGPLPYESEDILVLKEELRRGKDFLKRMSDLRARCVTLDWKYNKKRKDGNESTRSDRDSKTKQLAIKCDYQDDTLVPRHPSKKLGMESQQALIEMSHEHETHRGRFGVNDLELNEDSELKRHVDVSIFEQESPRSPRSSHSTPSRNRKRKEKHRHKDGSNKTWLKMNGLAAKKMTLMDALGSTVVRQKRKYVAIIDTYVLSKVFEDVLPIAHVSPRNKSEIRLINPNGAHLEDYEKKLKKLLEIYRKRLNRQIWDHLPKREREKYGRRETFFYVRSPEYEIGSTTIEEINAILEENNWPLPKHELKVLLDEIRLGERYLQLSIELRAAAASISSQSKKPDPKPQSSNNKKSRKDRKISTSSSSPSSSSSSSLSTDARTITSETSPSETTKISDNDLLINQNEQEQRQRNLYSFQSILNSLAGEAVIARSEFDGYFYDAVLIKCLDQYYSLIRFNHGEQQVTSNQFVLPHSRNVSLPPLMLGNHVLAKTRTSASEPVHYIPGIVIGVPTKRAKFPNHYKILLFNNKRKRALRQTLYKINEGRYTMAVEFIRSRIEKYINFIPFQE